ncbi:MAG: pyruvate kinase [Candidatus Aminicenantes bacterium]|jgi:pyruvate kinase
MMIKPVRKKNKLVKTKIVATIGPSSQDERVLLRMVKAGMSVVRLNFSHGSHHLHREVIKKIRKISKDEDIPVAILQDLSGPKIRLGQLPGPVELKKNQLIKLSINQTPEAHLYTDFKALVDIVKKNETILVDDGNIELLVKDVQPTYVMCRVKVPGIAKSRKGINLPETDITIPVFTEKDRRDLEFGLEQGVDLVAMSFVDSPRNIVPIKEMMEKFSREVPVIAKIERPIALTNIERIMDVFDGIMVARGDLGVEVPPEEVPVIQKKLIHLANMKNKLVITATQMLESMIDNSRPTRAEASDVSNAILDGSDAVMLSGETAVGRYPVKAVQMMRRIAQTTESSQLYQYSNEQKKEDFNHTEAIVRSAAEIAKDLKAKYIFVYSFSGDTALRLSKYRPHCPVFAFTSQKDVVIKMASYWGIFPYFIPLSPNTDEMIRQGEERLKSKKQVKPGELVITVSGMSPIQGTTNMLKISRFGDLTSKVP